LNGIQEVGGSTPPGSTKPQIDNPDIYLPYNLLREPAQQWRRFSSKSIDAGH
jgi:hypothetical protein